MSMFNSQSKIIFTLLSLIAVMYGASSNADGLGQIERISESQSGQFGIGYSYSWASNANHFSANGRYVAFYSVASNLVEGDNNGRYDVFVYDRETGAMELISRASAGENSLGAQGNNNSYTPAISANGRYVAFSSSASNLIESDGNHSSDIFVYDREARSTELLSRASRDDSGLGVQGNHYSHSPSISGDGRYVAFYSYSTNLIGNDSNGNYADIFVYDREAKTIELVSRASQDENGLGEQGNSASFNPSISADGRYVAFRSHSTNLVENTSTSYANIFVYDRETDTTELVSRASSNENGLGAPGNHHSDLPSISADGRYVAYRSHASNFLANDVNNSAPDIFVYDRQTNTNQLISRASSDVNGLGEQGNSHSYNPSISADGRYVTFRSSATNLVENDNNGGINDIFVYDRDTNTIELVSNTESDEQGNDNSFYPVISPDASAVLFSSYATNFAGPQNYLQVFVKTLTTNTVPIADAGNDTVLEATANPNSDVMLDGSASSDADGDSLTYRWLGDFGEASGETVTIDFPLGAHTITLTVSDGQLESSDEVIITVVDTTPPLLTVPQDIQTFASGPLTQVELGEAEASDLFDVSIANDAPDLFAPGETVVTWTATDTSGNTTSAQQTVVVRYDFIGFYNPIENLPVLNVAKAGQVIPVKWSVPANQGGFIADTSIVSAVQFSTESCNDDTVSSTDISEAQTTGSSGLRYDETDEQFVFNWKTRKAMKGSCRMLHLSLNDGSVHQVKFMLR